MCQRPMPRRLHGTGIWPITFEIAGGEVCNLDLEDYH